MSIESLVHVEIEARLKQMRDMDTESDEYKVLADSVMKFIDRANEMENLSIRIKENDLKEKQFEEDRKSKKWDHGIRITSIVAPLTFALIGAFGFSVIERTDIISSSPARRFMERILRV